MYKILFHDNEMLYDPQVIVHLSGFVTLQKRNFVTFFFERKNKFVT